MHVSVCQIELRLPENHSLKGKRQVIKSITTRIQNRFNVSVAEVDNQNKKIYLLSLVSMKGNMTRLSTVLYPTAPAPLIALLL
jgi:Uncharacterized protein conserved in bacteria